MILLRMIGQTAPPVALETGLALKPVLMCAGAQQEALQGKSSCPVCARSQTPQAQRHT